MWEAPHLTPAEFDGKIWRDLQNRSQQYRRPSSSRHTPLLSAADSPHVTHAADPSQATLIATEVHPYPDEVSRLQPHPTSAPTGRSPEVVASRPPIVIASVVPSQTHLWQTWLDRTAYPHRILSLADIPLAGLYPTLGIDRALAGLGVGQHLGFPCLTIDGGTALTFTGFANVEARSSARSNLADRSDPSSSSNPSNPSEQTPAQGLLIGGAILPGMGLQYRSLGQQTAQLSAVRSSFDRNAALRPFPATRWARDTLGAIDSGIHRAIGAIAWDFITDWQRRYPTAIVAITGGDALAIEVAIQEYVQDHHGRTLGEAERTRIKVIPEAIIWGMIAAVDAIALIPHSPDTSGDSW